jgi:Ti-type conjugative transfer relaxase TraA
MNPRLNIGKGVSGAARYVLGQGRDPKTNEVKRAAAGESRVDWIGGQNFGFRIANADDAELARRIMEFDSLNQRSRTRQCEQDCVHLALSWKPGEKPSRLEMEETAREALKALGMENAKALFVAHNDEDYAHVHIIASKINPATGRAYDLAGSYRTLSRWAQDYELAHGGILSTRREGANELRDAIANRDADAVLSALTKQRATFTSAQLHRALEKEIIGAARGQARTAAEKELARFQTEVIGRGQVVELVDQQKHGRGELPARRFTTQAVLDAEQQVIVAVHALAKNFSHSVSDRTRKKVAAGKTMSDEQARAFGHATCAGGFAAIDGQAGTGKSYTLAAVREAYEATGYEVIGLAPTNKVVKGMMVGGFRHAATIHAELFALNNGKRQWNARTVIIVDEAAMLDTKLVAMVTSHAAAAGAKLILAGDDRQLSSIDHGGMFTVLKSRHGAAELTEVKRQHKNDERRASEMFASGNFHDALNIYDNKRAIQWTRTQAEARAALIDQWAQDSAAEPDKTRFVFAYTNAEVATLNVALRGVRKARGELGVADASFETKHGRGDFATADRIQFTGTDKKLGINNGDAGTIKSIKGNEITVRIDGDSGETVTFNAAAFDQFRHGYAGTIYAGQGATLDQTYLYHSEYWRSAASYVAMTRHRDKAALFVARNTARDVKQLAQQMGRTDDRRAASMFEIKRRQRHLRHLAETPRPLSPAELLAVLSPQPIDKGAINPAPIKPRQRDSTLSQPGAAEPRAAHRGERQARHYAAMDAARLGAEPSRPANHTEAEIVQRFETAGDRVTERAPGNFDRDAANADWQGRVDAASIAHGDNGDPRKARSAEPRETMLEDTYPPVDPAEVLHDRPTAAGIPTPKEASTGTVAPESGQSAGIFARAAHTISALIFGRPETDAADPGERADPQSGQPQTEQKTEVPTEQERQQQAAPADSGDSERTDDEMAQWTPKRRQRQRRGQSL